MDDELVLIDQSQLRQRQRELHASHEKSLARLLLELPDGLPQVAAHELRVPVDPLQGARHDVLLCRVDRAGEGFHPGFHPLGQRTRLRVRPPRGLHHLVGHPAEEEGIGPVEVLGRVTMQLLVGDHLAMIAAAVQGDVDGVPKRSHRGRGHSPTIRSRTGQPTLASARRRAKAPLWTYTSRQGAMYAASWIRSARMYPTSPRSR